MRHSFLILLVLFFLSSCSQNMKFSKEIWCDKGAIFINNKRERMADDVIKSYLQKRPLYTDVIAYLGEPDRIDSLDFGISYIIHVYINGCAMVDDSDMKFLDIRFDEDSTVSEADIREWKQINSRYRFN